MGPEGDCRATIGERSQAASYNACEISIRTSFKLVNTPTHTTWAHVLQTDQKDYGANDAV